MDTITNGLTDDAVLRELGERIAAARIRADLTQANLAREAGVSLAAVRRLEAGTPVSSDRFVRVLRVLRLLPGLEQLAPSPGPSPLEMVDRSGGRRRRVRTSARERPSEPWSWGDG